MMNEIRCILVDDEKDATARLAILLSKIENIKIAGIFNEPDLALKAIADIRPDLVFSDVEMPRMSGFDLVSEVKRTGFAPTFIFVTGYNQYAIKAIKAAAFDYLVKPVDLDELKEAIHRFREIMPRTAFHDPATRLPNTLSEREKEIIRLLIECKTSKEIADILFISKNTVDTHRRHILEKLDLKNTQELMKFAINNNLTSE